MLERVYLDHLNAEKTLSLAQRSVSDKTGIIHELFEVMIGPDDPKLFHIGAKLANVDRIFLRAENPSKDAGNGGVGLTRSIAEAAAIGECIERYCLSFIEPSKLISSSYDILKSEGHEAVDPSHLALFSKRQYSQRGFMFKEFTKGSKVNWVEGFSLLQQKPIHIPASLVYIPYPHHGSTSNLDFIAEDEHLAHAFSTGTACASSKEEALLKGIYEVIERDAFLITWLNQISCPLMDLKSGTWINKVFGENFSVNGLKFYVANMTMDISIPSMLALIVDEKNDGLAVSVGAATNLDAEKAALKALTEAAQTRMFLKYNRSNQNKSFSKDFSNVNSLLDHILLYGKLESISYLEFLTTSKNVQTFDSISIPQPNQDMHFALKMCLKVLARRKLDIIVTDLTTPDVRELGLNVIKILIPGMQDLNAEHNYRRLGGRRLYSVPKMLGLVNKEPKEENLNRVPHPFP